MEINAITRKWGNSIAVIIPKEIVDTRKIRENEKIIVEFKSPLLVKDIFGSLKGKISRSAQEIKDELREGWLSESDRKREEEWKKRR